MNIANKLTVLRMLLIPVFLYLFVVPMASLGTATARYLAIVVFCVAAATDFLDGYLARKLGLITNFGKFLDPVADKMLVTSALIAMIPVVGFPAWVVIIIVGRDTMLTSFRMIANGENVVIAADNLGKIKTVLQMIMIPYLMWTDLLFSAGGYDTFDLAVHAWVGWLLMIAVTILTVLSAASYLIKNRHVLNLEDM